MAEEIRLAELVGALSPATDVGMGAPLELGLGTCVVGTRLAAALGADPDTTRRCYYLALLRHVGCTAGSHEFAAVVGDEIAFRGGIRDADYTMAKMLRHTLRA